MTFEKLDHTESFLNFFKVNFPNEQVPPCPKQPSDLNMTVRMALSSWDQGKLYQNLFSNSGAPSAPKADYRVSAALGLQPHQLI